MISQQRFTAGLHDLQQTASICCNQNNQLYNRKINPMFASPGGRAVLSKVSPAWVGLSSQGAVTKFRSTETFLLHSLKVSRPCEPALVESHSHRITAHTCEGQHLSSLTHTAGTECFQLRRKQGRTSGLNLLSHRESTVKAMMSTQPAGKAGKS